MKTRTVILAGMFFACQSAMAATCSTIEIKELLRAASHQDTFRTVSISWQGASEVASEGEEINIRTIDKTASYFKLNFAGADGIETNEFWFIGKNVLYLKTKKLRSNLNRASVEKRYFCPLQSSDLETDKDLNLISYATRSALVRGISVRIP